MREAASSGTDLGSQWTRGTSGPHRGFDNADCARFVPDPHSGEGCEGVVHATDG